MEILTLDDVVIKLKGVRDILAGLATGDTGNSGYYLLSSIVDDCTEALENYSSTKSIE